MKGGGLKVFSFVSVSREVEGGGGWVKQIKWNYTW